VIKGIDFRSQVFHQSLERSFGSSDLIVATLFCSVAIQLSILKHLLLGYRWQNLEGNLLMNRLLVCLFKIYHRSFWQFSGCILEFAKLADMVREMVQEMHLHKVDIRVVDKMLHNF